MIALTFSLEDLLDIPAHWRNLTKRSKAGIEFLKCIHHIKNEKKEGWG